MRPETSQVPPSAASLGATEFLDHDSADVGAFVAEVLSSGADTPVQRAVDLYYGVRDGIRYEVYGADLSREGLRASNVARSASGMCLHKSILYAACLRNVGVPSRLVLTDVRNHLSSPRIRSLVGGDVFHQHCLTALYLGGRWLTVTPVFNRVLCGLYKMRPLEFDGTADSVHHPYSGGGSGGMEFLRTHGTFEDLPYEMVLRDLREAHPGLFGRTGDALVPGSLVDDAHTLGPKT
ncbi:transglutaminase-like putative cysteine protease [Nocardiopsis arvandica]|uniref:Transglutaminase-like putative cysteine protease n=1 Tax=Nocardiopsis sinuspersici TaxID=501010 RepID=A0A7Y9XH09_9ACTN|nr:transglutaminase-like domain-containing protein [Nocardiopsis sinuspersici]NYH55672.1 transglutaminase-like putative cysteine protease [Nocardiopsis sinuspersici]